MIVFPKFTPHAKHRSSSFDENVSYSSGKNKRGFACYFSVPVVKYNTEAEGSPSSFFMKEKGFISEKSAPQRCALALSEDVASDCARRESSQSGLFIGCVKGRILCRTLRYIENSDRIHLMR